MLQNSSTEVLEEFCWIITGIIDGKPATSNKTSSDITANKAASRLVQNGRFDLNKKWPRKVKCNLRRELNKLKPNPQYSKYFALLELDIALGKTKSGKAAGLDNIYPEFLKHL